MPPPLELRGGVGRCFLPPPSAQNPLVEDRRGQEAQAWRKLEVPGRPSAQVPDPTESVRKKLKSRKWASFHNRWPGGTPFPLKHTCVFLL